MLGIVVVIGTKPYRCEGLIVGHRTAMDHDIIDLELLVRSAEQIAAAVSYQSSGMTMLQGKQRKRQQRVAILSG